jgi:hypothetical protein
LNGVNYKVVFTVQSTTDDTSVKFVTGGLVPFTDLGLIDKNVMKTYTRYFTAFADTFCNIELYGGSSITRTIEFQHFSIEPVYGTTIQGGLNTNGVLSTDRVRLNYTVLPTFYNAFTGDQIGYTVKTDLVNDTVIPAFNQTSPPNVYAVIQGKIDGLPIGIWLVSAQVSITGSGGGGGNVQFYIIKNASAADILTGGGATNPISGLIFLPGSVANSTCCTLTYTSTSYGNSYGIWLQTNTAGSPNKVYGGFLQMTRIG